MGDALDTVLTEIRGLRSDVREDQSKIWDAIERERKCTTQLKINDAKLEGEITQLKLKQNMTEEAFVRHVQNKDKHFNPYYSETLRQKLWRKKPEIAAGGGAGALIVALVTLLLKASGVIP